MVWLRLWAVILPDGKTWNGINDTPRLYKYQSAASAAIATGKKKGATPTQVILMDDQVKER